MKAIKKISAGFRADFGFFSTPAGILKAFGKMLMYVIWWEIKIRNKIAINTWITETELLVSDVFWFWF